MFLANRSTLATLELIPSGRAGVLMTLAKMRSLVQQGKKNLKLRELALSLVGDLPGKDYLGEVRRVQQWVKGNIRYVPDIRNVETLHTIDKLLEQRQGDCDDQAMLVACLLETLGKHTRFRAIGFKPGEFEHVFTEVRLGNQWVPVETTEPVDVGWLPRGIVDDVVLEN